jgi:hypothetical protein
MSGEHEIDKSFPYFEEHNVSGWLIQFKAMLRELDCDEVIVETRFFMASRPRIRVK